MGHIKFYCIICKSKPGPRFNTERHIWTRHVRQTMGPSYIGSYYEPAEHKKLVIHFMAVLENPKQTETKHTSTADYNWYQRPSTSRSNQVIQLPTEQLQPQVFPLRSPYFSTERLHNIYQPNKQRAESDPLCCPIQVVPQRSNALTEERGYDLTSMLSDASSQSILQYPPIRSTSDPGLFDCGGMPELVEKPDAQWLANSQSMSVNELGTNLNNYYKLYNNQPQQPQDNPPVGYTSHLPTTQTTNQYNMNVDETYTGKIEHFAPNFTGDPRYLYLPSGNQMNYV